MRGTRAKELRKIAYGDQSLKAPRQYEKFITTFRIRNKIDAITGKPITRKSISFFNKARTPRATYQLMKRGYKQSVQLSPLHQ